MLFLFSVSAVEIILFRKEGGFNVARFDIDYGTQAGRCGLVRSDVKQKFQNMMITQFAGKASGTRL